MRARGPAAVQRRHPPRRRRLRRAGVQPLGRARLHEPPEPASTSRASRSATRTARPSDPIVIAGGHCAYNPEPLAEYVDAFVIGDGEEVIGEIAEVVGAWKRGRPRVARSGAARARDDRRRVRARRCTTSTTTAQCIARGHARVFADVPAVVDKRTVADLAEWPYPKQQLVPLVEVVHDRLNVEIFRGCTRGCRFCQAGMITRPVRERPEEQVRTMVREGLRRTGYDEVALTSLSSADFSGHRRRRRRPRQRPGGHRQRQRLAAEPAGRRVQRRRSRARSRRCAAPG